MATTKIIANLDYLSVHPISTASNIPSVWFYYRDEFRAAFASVFETESTTIFNVLSKFREGKTLKKTKENSITIKELLSLPEDVKGQKLQQYYDELRSAMGPPKELQLQYSGSNKERIRELANRICLLNRDYHYHLDTNNSVYKLVRGFHQDSYIQFPYAIEALAIPYKVDVFLQDLEKEYSSRFIGSVNYSISPKGNDFECAVDDDYDKYYFQVERRKGHKKVILSGRATSIKGIFEAWGFSFSRACSGKLTKLPSVIIVNVISPRIDYYGEDKSKINVEPFKAKIIEVAEQISKSIQTFGETGEFEFEEFTDKRKSAEAIKHNKKDAIKYLEDWLRERHDKIELDPSLKNKDSVTKQGSFYRIRIIMLKDGFVPEKDWGKTRKYLVGAIDDVVERLWHGEVDREDDLGITAGARGIMYYKGQQIPVTIDNFKELAKKGVAAIVCEKEGIVKQLAPYAAEYAVVLVNTRGHLVKYVKQYIKERKEKLGLIIGMLVDFDKDGQDIAVKESGLSKTLIIGIVKESIGWFQKEENIAKFGYKKFTIADVAEKYNPDINKVDDEFLKTNRIELDSIISIVGAEAFWEYVAHRLQLKKIFSPRGFDYSDEVSMPESKDLYFKEMNELIDLVDDYIEDITEDERDEIIDNELNAADKLIEVKSKEEDIKKRLSPKVTEDSIITKIAAPKIRALIDDLKKEIDKHNKAAAS